MSTNVERTFAPTRELERLNRRIATITGTELARELSRYRRSVNKLTAINERGVRAFPYATTRGKRYRAEDEVRLCHRFLDEQSVDPMYL